ncbi:hypothetical protein ACU3L3_07355 [Priestia endophytica]
MGSDIGLFDNCSWKAYKRTLAESPPPKTKQETLLEALERFLVSVADFNPDAQKLPLYIEKIKKNRKHLRKAIKEISNYEFELHYDDVVGNDLYGIVPIYLSPKVEGEDYPNFNYEILLHDNLVITFQKTYHVKTI